MLNTGHYMHMSRMRSPWYAHMHPTGITGQYYRQVVFWVNYGTICLPLKPTMAPFASYLVTYKSETHTFYNL